MLIDEVKIRISSGHGGKGASAFNKNLMSLGPAGGSGGKGGSVYALSVSNLNALHEARYKKEFKAQNGEDGRGQFRDGHDGKDMEIKMPVGSVITFIETNAEFTLSKIGEKLLLAKGGLGGKGNFHFRSAHNTSPKYAQAGLPGENFELNIELKLIADVGLIGLPNAGKSSLLNELTNSKSTVGNYPFTTLEPHLGAYYNLIIADIPGLIEGSSTGKGLGHKFLRHIERTQVLFHLISAESDDIIRDYNIIRTELLNHNKELIKKQEYIFITKSDLVDNKILKNKLATMRKIKKTTLPISIHNDDELIKIKTLLNNIQDKKIIS